MNKLPPIAETIEIIFGVEYDFDKSFRIDFTTEIRKVLIKAYNTTKDQINEGTFKKFNISDKFNSTEICNAKLDEPIFKTFFDFNQNLDWEHDPNFSKNLKNIRYYFITIGKGDNRIICIKKYRSVNYAKKGNFLFYEDDKLNLFKSEILGIAHDFDLVIFKDNLYILHPNSMISLLEINDIIEQTAINCLNEIEKRVNFIDLSSIKQKILSSTRAAKYVISIHGFIEKGNLTKSKLVAYLNENEIKYSLKKGYILPDEGKEIDFLQALDKRRFNVNIYGSKELLEANSRNPIEK